jgi:hypothetical protein
VTGTNNTVGATNAATGQGVLINRAQIDAGGVTFKKVSTTGGTNGIKLDTTGTAGGFTIAGDGGGANNGSGGTIQTSTAEGILTNSTGAISLGYLNVNNSGTDSISVTGSTGVTINRTNVTDNAGVSGDEGFNLINNTGTITLTNDVVDSAPHHQSFIDNNNTNLTAINVSNSTFKCTVGNTCQPVGSVGADGFLVQIRGTSVLTSANVQTSSFTGNRATGFQVTAADTASIGSSSGGTITAPAASHSFVLQTSTIQNNNAGIDFSKAQNSNMTFQVLNNTTITGHRSNAINTFSAAGGSPTTGGTLTGNIDGNVIGTQGTKDSGSAIGIGIRAIVQGDTTQGFITINNNTIREVPNAHNVELFSQNGNAASGTGAARFKVTNNTFPLPSGTNQSIGCGAGVPCMADGVIFSLADEHNTACLLITGNNVFDANTFSGVFDVYLATRTGPPAGAATTVQTGVNGGNSAAALAFINANNTLNGTLKSFDEAGNITTVSSCGTFPPLLLGEGGVMSALTAPSLVSSLLVPAAGSARCGDDNFGLFSGNSKAIDSSLTQRQLDQMVSAAIDRWSAAGLTAAQAAQLRGMRFEVGELANDYLGEAEGNRILVDREAQGKGWFIDATPQDDAEFATKTSTTRRYTDPMNAAAGRVDLLTAIEHEMGHKLGLNDSYSQKDRDSIMYGYLTVGERRTPAFGEAMNARPEAISGVHHLTLGLDKRSEVRGQKSGVSKNPDVRLNHVRNSKLGTRSSKLSSPLTPFAACSPAGINGGGTAICVDIPTIHDGQSITISFQVTVNNPPNLTGVPPGTPQVSNFGTVTGACPNCPVTTNTVTTPVDLFTTTTGVVSSTGGTSNQGDAVTFTATVNETPVQASADPTGTVQFLDGATPLTCSEGGVNGIRPVSGGTAACTTSAITPAGSPHTINANYSGDGNFKPSGGSTSQTVIACGTNPVVTNTNDSGAGSLRDAITNVCSSPNNNVTFNIPGADPNHVGGVYTITLTTGEIQIAKDVNVTGPNSIANTDPIIISGNNNGRVFSVAVGKSATISNLNVTGGNGNGGNGGAIATAGTLNLIGMAIYGNTATGQNGGGIYNNTTGTLRIINSTLSGNSALLGGGVYNDGTLVLTNATISGNTAANFGGGLYNNGTGTFTMNNTIVAGNTVEDIHTGSGAMSGDYNLIGDTTGITGGPSGSNNVLNQTANLGALAFNGGVSKTMALLANSPAIEAGNNTLAVDQTSAALTTDQRGTGFPRIADSFDLDTTATVDIGAFELHPSIEDIPNQTTAEDTQKVVTFNIGDDVSSGGTLIQSVQATSSNTSVVTSDNVHLAITGSGGSRTLTITPNTNASGTTTITVTVTATNGRTAVDTFDLSVTAVNDPPSGADKTVTILEDSSYTFATGDFGFTDPNDTPANNLQAVKITTLPAAGTLTDNNVAVTVGQFIPVADITGGLLKFTPAADGSGSPYASFTFQVQDDGAGTDLDPTPNTITINVTAVNDAPAGADNTVTTNEDTAYTFTTGDFGFSDPNDTPANTLLAVKIATLPAAGTLTNNNVAVTAGQSISVADITGGKLKFTPAADASGSPYASFTFQVQDDGTTNNGGVDLDQSPNTMTINVTAVNDAPAGADKTVTINEDTSYTFATGDFGFTDPNDTPANTLSAVKITTLPAAGTLTNNNVAVTAGQSISVADITGGKLKFTPAADGSGSPYASFTFQVQDDGTTNNGGVDLDQSPNTMTINVTAVNDAPAGADNTVTTNEDTAYTFTTTDFGFTDPNDTPANTLLAVKITTLPAAGTLTNNNVAVTAGQSISVADITGGKLKFTPAADANGSPYASFTFQVQDDGNTNNGGVDLDQSPNTMTINVTSVNDAPAGADKTVTTTINTAYVFTTTDFGFTDPNDTPANTLLAVKITTLPAAGTLTDNNVAVVAGQFIPVADITAGNLKFTPAANASGSPYASFTFQVQDDGTTNNGGVDLDQSPNTMTINVGQPALSVLDAVRAEPTSGTANMLFTVVMNPQLAAQSVTVDYQTANGGANPATSGTCGNPGVDYQPTSGTLTFNPGETTKTIKVSICSDNVNEADETLLLNLSNSNGATISRSQATGTIKQANLAGTFIISEIRTSGPGGLGDDFVELYNNTDTPLTVAASDASAGYGVFKMGTNCNATPVLIATIPNGTVIPARGHYLLVGSQYSLGAYATGDQTLTSDIESDRNVGVFNTADVNNLSTVTRLDAVGFGTNTDGVTTGACDLLREGSNLPAASGSTLEYSFFRKECDFQGTGCTISGTPKDTNDNSVDFLFADTQGTLTPMGQLLGAPGPQNKTSGVQRNATLVMPLLDSTIAASGAPNRVRDNTPNTPNSTIGPLGTLSIRRRIQNNTGGDVTALRFRIIDITSFPSPVGTADLRATTSSDVAVSNIHDTTTCVDRTAGTASNCTVNVKGTTLEQPPNQTKGGAFNSSLKVDLTGLPGSKLAAGSSVEIQLLFGVVQPGHFRVLVNVEDDIVGGDSHAPGVAFASFIEDITIPGNQTISFNSIANRTFGDSDFNLTATASSGLPVSYAGSGTCAVTSAGNVHLTGAGTCTVTASQSGDASHSPATSQQTFAIDKATPATSVSSSLIAAKLTQNVTFTATVTPPANTTAATGTVQFRDGGVDIGPAVALDANGVATFSTAALTAGTHTITAVYSGNSNFNASAGMLATAQVVTNRPLVNMAAANYEVKQSDGFVRVVVNRAGDASVPVTVDYATDGSASGNCASLSGVASLRCDVTAMYGTFRFAAGEIQKTLDIPINQDAYTQGPETFTVNLSNVTGTDALLVTPASANITINDATSPTPNAIDDTTIFVRQQYHDFLNREPDAAGLAFWKNNIDVCNTDPTEAARYGGARACVETKRVITSAAFFLSIEFRGTGGLVRDFYVAALNRPASGNMPAFVEFTRDTQAVQNGVVVGQANWEKTLNDNRAAWMADFVMRSEFIGLYPTTDTPAQYVDKLYSHASVTPDAAERNAAIAEFGSATSASDSSARGRALLRITQSDAFQRRELNRGFVQMQYFGYLRRNPNDDPDGNLIGFSFWLGKLNQFNGDFIGAEMVKAFLASSEYRQRFGTP